MQLTLAGDPRCWIVSELIEESEYETILKDPLLYSHESLARFCPGTKNNLVSIQKSQIVAIGSPDLLTLKIHLENLDAVEQAEAEQLEEENELQFPSSSAIH